MVPAEVKPGEAVTVTVTITNTGGVEGVYTLVLEVNGNKEATQEIAVAAGGVESVSFKVNKQEAETYTLDVNGLTGSFKVVASAPAPEPTPVTTPTPTSEITTPLPSSTTPAPWTPEPLPPESESTINWLLIGVVTAVVVILIIFFIFKFATRRD